MMTNWREVRDTLYSEAAFSTFNTIGHRGNSEEIREDAASNPLVNSADMVKSSKNATRHLGCPTVKSVNSAKRSDLRAEDSWEWVEERSAILEIENGFTRKQADWLAFELWFERFVNGSAK